MLCSMKELLEDAEKEKKAVASFSTYNMETVKGVVEAAEQTKSAVILQIAESRFETAPLHLMAPMMVEAAKNATVPIAVHLDHGIHFAVIEKAIQYGFTSVMLDASSKPIEENISMTNQVLKLAHKNGITVEAEVGSIGGNEGMGTKKVYYTDPDEATAFFTNAPVDALAIAIGNAHGNYQKTPDLQFPSLKNINERISVPLVLHGGTGISFSDFRKCIKYGIRKINIATGLLDTMLNTANDYTKTGNSYLEMSSEMQKAVCVKATKLINVFNNKIELGEI